VTTDVFLIIGGLALVALTLADVFETVLAPGGSEAFLKVVRRTVFLVLPVWKRATSNRRGISGMFAPFVLLCSFVTWICFLALGFAAVIYALRSEFDPPLSGFLDAVYFAGSSIVTIGMSETDATGAARFAVLAAGLCGLAVITMAITYLLLVLNSVAKRDTGILKLNTTAGEPPSALTLLERMAELRLRTEIPRMMRNAREWCLTVRQSHATHPSLIYFQSTGAGVGWPAALGALLDLALFAELLIDAEELYGPAVLLRQDALKLAEQIADLVGLKPVPDVCSAELMNEVAARISRCGYNLKGIIDYEATAATRTQLQACVTAMAQHLGKPTTTLLR